MAAETPPGGRAEEEDQAAGHTRLPQHAIPTARSVLWLPGAELARPETDPYPIFVAQHALAAVQDHLGSAPGQGLLGFLVGRVLQCPETRVRYLVVEKGVRVPQMIVGDASEAVVAQSLVAVQRMLPPGGGELVGWYHSHPDGEPTLSTADRGAHVQYFQQPWHVALVLVIGAEQTGGGFFRPSGDPAAALPYLPFYEMLDAREYRGGLKQFIVSWSNYWSPDPKVWPASSVAFPSPDRETAVRTAVGPTRSRVAVSQFIPPAGFEAADDDDADDDDPAARRPPRPRRRWWLAAGGAVAIVALALSAWWMLGPPPPAPASQPVETASPPPPAPLAVSPDPVRRAVDAYRMRASLFANQQMTCGDLAQGLADVDAEWVRYTVGRTPAMLQRDTAKVSADQTLTAQVEGVERDFERTGCPRP